MIEVLIRPTAENYVPSPFDSDTIRGDILDWLRGNIRGQWTWEHEVRPSNSDFLPGGYRFAQFLVFRFTNPDEAALFKLTWA